MAVPVSFRWDEGFVARLDAARRTSLGVVSRSAFVRDAVELAIRRSEQARAMAVDADGEFARRAAERALVTGGRGSEDRGVSSSALPAPAEQPRYRAPGDGPIAVRQHAPPPAEQPERTIVEGLEEKDNHVVASGESFRWEREFRPYPKGGKR